jgi:hypothetical protein
MKVASKRVMCLVLVLSFSAWAQAVCPMMVFPQKAQDCDQHPVRPSMATNHTEEHERCPGMRAHSKHEQCERAKLSSRKSDMSCCAIEREPANAPKVLQAGMVSAVIGRVTPTLAPPPQRAATLDISDATPPDRGVLSFKEDLRI